VAIETGPALRLVFHQPLRQTEGAMRSIVGLLGVALAIPDHTTFSAQRSFEILLAQVSNDDGKQVVFSSMAAEADRPAGAALADTIERIRWRLWHGQVKRALDLVDETAGTLEASAEAASSTATSACKVTRPLRELEIYVSGLSGLIIDYATARRSEEPISTAVTESTLQWLLHRRMNAQQQMRGAHLMLKVRTAAINGTLERDHVAAERWTRRPLRHAA
jgi:Transposase DDE domain